MMFFIINDLMLESYTFNLKDFLIFHDINLLLYFLYDIFNRTAGRAVISSASSLVEGDGKHGYIW